MEAFVGLSDHRLCRHNVCFSLAFTQIICGGCLLALGIVEVVQPRHEMCEDRKESPFFLALLHCVAGSFGVAAYKRGINRGLNLMFVTVFIILCLLVILPFTFNLSVTSCMISLRSSFNRQEKIQFGIVLTRVIVVIITHIVAAISVGLSSLDLHFCTLALDGAKPQKVQENDGNKQESARNSTRQTVQLPEARIHVQEALGTGEKLTVVTLPVQEGFVYAVPEDQYVIRRLEGTYVAPSTNPFLASFFPSYTKINVE
ncbi:uncharacterized protein LOC143234847 [Tachypleus tridentatus]|uniref:uncharacterized protein LOC143234847 n=1 Tax=Tachypleus tridentatus TaxID=6853 RepID=UPI003FD6BED9